MNEWQSRGVAEGGFVEEEVTGWRPRGWLRVCQGNKEGRSVLGSVDSMGEGMGGWRAWHTWDIGRHSVRLGEGLREVKVEVDGYAVLGEISLRLPLLLEGPNAHSYPHQHNLPSPPTSMDTQAK